MKYEFEITEKEFRLMQDLIHERFGILFKEEKRSYIQMKLYTHLTSLGFASFSEYINFVKYDPEAGHELSRMISLLTNNETYFFREMPQLLMLRDHLLPEFREKGIARNEKRIKILSAGCSSGEEAYTLAMLTHDSGSFFWGWDISIIGMDISERALESACQGIYYERSLRMTDPAYKKRYFIPNSGDFLVRDNIRNMVSFMWGNITTPLPVRDFDIILCRNVFIYFSEGKMKSGVKNLHDALRPGGYLLLGHSETLTGISDEFETRRFPETIIYKKKGP
jgi:chemotaxis protein methyltransferase CheR